MSEPNEAVMLDLQADLVARAAADEFVGCVPVFDERKGDIFKDLQQSLGVLTGAQGKLGAAVILLAPIGDVEYPDVPGGPLNLELTWRVLEEPFLNLNPEKGTGKAALELCHRLVRLFQTYHPQGLATPLRARKPTIVPVRDELATVAYEVRFEAVEEGVEFDKVMTPMLSITEGAAPQAVTITCGTAGAQIYYTLDGKHPSAANGVLYTGPVTVGAAGMLRAGAFKTGSGLIPSDVAAGIFT